MIKPAVRRSLFGKRGRPPGAYGHYLKKPKLHFLTRGRLSIKGIRVVHSVFGTGTVVEEWGSFRACRGCYLEVSAKDSKNEFCPVCRNGPTIQTGGLDAGSFWLQVGGKDIYDILFDGEKRVRCINREWLKVC